MRPSLLIVLGTAIAALAAAAPEAPASRRREVSALPRPLDAPPVGADQSPNVDLHRHEKRGLCIYLLGICLGLGSPGYDDVANCGTCCNRCSDQWANGGGAACHSGICMPGYCDQGFTRNERTASCVNLPTDPHNWRVKLDSGSS